MPPVIEEEHSLEFFCEESLNKINTRIEQIFDAKCLGPMPAKLLHEPCIYAVLKGGKRIRPLLCLAAGRAFRVPESKLLNAACSLELLHNYSLIHDDLPAMDNDDYRRGRPTVHKQFGEDKAILAGDFLLTLSFSVIADDEQLSPTVQCRLLKELACCGGAEGLIGGQLLDLQNSHRANTTSEKELQQIYSYKTARLLQTSLCFAAIAAEASPKETLLLRRAGYELGLAYQIIDDHLDKVNCNRKTGKRRASDACNKKNTFATLFTAEELLNKARFHTEKALQLILLLKKETQMLQSFILKLARRNF